MKSTNKDHRRLFAFATLRLPGTGLDKPLLVLVVRGLVVMVVLLCSACIEPSPAPPSLTPVPVIRPTETPAPTSTPTETTTPISTPTETPEPQPTLIPLVRLEEPKDGSCFGLGGEIELRWSCPYVLQDKDCYRLSVRGWGSSPVYTTLNHLSLSTPPLGKYRWAVAIVHLTDSGEYVALSKESEWNTFEITLPSPTPLRVAPTPAPIYPAPTLRRPTDGDCFQKATEVELGWDWNYQEQLGENEYFAIRVYPKGALVHHSVTWTKSTAYRVALYGKPEGDYCWHVVVLRGTGSEDWIALSPESQEWCFYAIWPPGRSETHSTTSPNETPPAHD